MFKIKIKKTKMLISVLVGVLALSMVQLPAVHAADSCFEAVGDTVDYDHGDTLYAKLKATCDMELHSIAISFADTESFEGIEEEIPESVHSQISGVEISDDHLHLEWNIDESAPYVNVAAGEDLFSMPYHVSISTTAFKRNMPITIDYAEYSIGGEMRTEENLNLDTMLIVTHDDKEVLMITGIEKQEISYSGGPIALVGDLVVEDNPANITADDLEVEYYDAVSLVDEPSEPGDYTVRYSYEDDDYVALFEVPFTIKAYEIINTHIWSGHGEVSAPHFVDEGDDLHVEITPADGYEIMWVEYNGNDVTDSLNEDNSLDITGLDENAEIVVAFRRFYLVTDGDGGEHTLGSGENLAFMVDKDPTSYTEGEVTIKVDDLYIDLETDSVVEPEEQTVTLLGGYLDTLEPGEHSVEIYFFDTGVAGIARATFVIVGEDEEDEVVPVPDTGAFTAEAAGAEVINIVAVISGIVIVTMLAVVKMFLKKKAQ